MRRRSTGDGRSAPLCAVARCDRRSSSSGQRPIDSTKASRHDSTSVGHPSNSSDNGVVAVRLRCRLSVGRRVIVCPRDRE